MAILLREATEKKKESVMRKVHFRFAVIVVSLDDPWNGARLRGC